ncbi:hypothetical protein HHK36_019385 [Tetracentron sinense]|uniref:Endonuclease/exonuclease/phosphatase domain-containing protein n=1 Tax=Tetracentron sinense TaxID=13715 RepID=A0A834YTR4_TETSI|nr:hypothetical protein HHK36_019385 [Tetracentron sinense]
MRLEGPGDSIIPKVNDSRTTALRDREGTSNGGALSVPLSLKGSTVACLFTSPVWKKSSVLSGGKQAGPHRNKQIVTSDHGYYIGSLYQRYWNQPILSGSLLRFRGPHSFNHLLVIATVPGETRKPSDSPPDGIIPNLVSAEENEDLTREGEVPHMRSLKVANKLVLHDSLLEYHLSVRRLVNGVEVLGVELVEDLSQGGSGGMYSSRVTGKRGGSSNHAYYDARSYGTSSPGPCFDSRDGRYIARYAAYLDAYTGPGTATDSLGSLKIPILIPHQLAKFFRLKYLLQSVELLCESGIRNRRKQGGVAQEGNRRKGLDVQLEHEIQHACIISRESEFREHWLTRNESILDRLLMLKSSIICLQEFWVGNEELVRLYETRLGDAGYATYKLVRTNNRGDGTMPKHISFALVILVLFLCLIAVFFLFSSSAAYLVLNLKLQVCSNPCAEPPLIFLVTGLLTAVHRNHFQVLNSRDLLFNDFGDRVAQLLHVELVMHFSQIHAINREKEALVVNTHLLFPHNSSYCFHRLQQVYKILRYIESYCDEYHLPPVPIILCGDWNGSKRGHIYKFLRSQGFVSSYDIAHHYTDSDEDAHKWVSHRNHRGNVCGVDFIWLLNPTYHRKPLKESFMEAVLGNIMNCLLEVSSEGTDPNLLKTDHDHDNYITYSQFSQALTKLGLSGNPCDGLSTEDIKELWNHVDPVRGVIDFSHFDKAWNLHPFLQQREEANEEPKEQREQLPRTSISATTIGFKVTNAVLFPPEVEKGTWPANYSLSDHAQLTVEFSPVRMRCC